MTDSNSVSSQHSLSELQSRLIKARSNYLLIFLVSAICPALGFGIFSSSQSSFQTESSHSSSPPQLSHDSVQKQADTPTEQSSSQSMGEPKSSESVTFSGIDLPVTNTLCNKKGNFCIYGLARIVAAETGTASYTFSELVSGTQVNINGTIRIDNIERVSSGSRTFTFGFEDDQSQTTPGWAAAGFFNLDQDKDPAKPGILTKFKTTQSYGPKTPVGLENTSYLFPR